MNIVIVGNGSYCKKNGSKIDGFDYVVRMGSCSLKGHEEYVGTRTDMLRSSWDRLLYSNQKGKICIVNKITNFSDFLFLEPYYDPFYETLAYHNYAHFYKIYNKPRFLQKRFNNVTNERIFHEICLNTFLSTKKIYYYTLLDRVALFCEYNKSYPDQTIHMPSAGLFTIDFIIKKFANSNIYITGFDGFKTKYYWRHNDEYFDSHSSVKERLFLKKLLSRGVVRLL